MAFRFSKKHPTLVGLGLIFLVWVISALAFWKFTPWPLDAQSFSLSFEILNHQRFVLPTTLAYPYTFIFVVLSFLIYGSSYALLHQILPPAQKLGCSLVLAAPFFFLTTLGSSASSLFHYFIYLLFLLPLFRRLSFVSLWILACVGAYISNAFPDYQFFIVWTVISLLIGPSLHFLLVERAQMKRAHKRDYLFYLPLFIGLNLLGFWVLAYILTKSNNLIVFSASHSFLFPYLCSLECIILAWFRPWDSRRWLTLNIFAQGGLLSPSLQFPLVLISAVLFLEILQSEGIEKLFFERVPKFIKTSFSALLILTPLAFMLYQAKTHHPERTWSLHWLQSLHAVEENKNEGFLIIGRGLPYLAHFIRGPLISDDSFLLEMNEKELLEKLSREKIQNILIDKTYLSEFWTQWIASGRTPEISNSSVITRAIQYQGKAVETKTMKLEELKLIEIKKIEGLDSLVWLVSSQEH